MMSEKKLRRFTRIEIVHHWCQAIPYIVLSGTGGMLLTCRALGIDLPSLGTAGLVHRVAGFALIGIWLQIAIVGIYSGDLRELLGSLRESISWKTRDIVWVFRVPLQIVWPGLRLPPSSRLNPGQKFHLLLTAIVIPLFTLSGLAMIFVPGALGAWILHTLLFFPALFFLGVHIFSALVNPETRKSSRSMVTGYVETELARAHHPLWVGDDSGAWENPPPHHFAAGHRRDRDFSGRVRGVWRMVLRSFAALSAGIGSHRGARCDGDSPRRSLRGPRQRSRDRRLHELPSLSGSAAVVFLYRMSRHHPGKDDSEGWISWNVRRGVPFLPWRACRGGRRHSSSRYEELQPQSGALSARRTPHGTLL